MGDLIILMIMALVVFGPRRLPEIGRQIGKLMYEFRKASNDFKFQMEEELRNAEEAERRKKEEERQRSLAAQVVPTQAVSEQASVSADPPAPVNAIESPYSGESHYPAQYPPETPVADAAVEETTPRIMPPSTGETVPAIRPLRVAELSEPLQEKQSSSASQTSPESFPAPEPELTPSQRSVAAEALNQDG